MFVNSPINQDQINACNNLSKVLEEQGIVTMPPVFKQNYVNPIGRVYKETTILVHINSYEHVQYDENFANAVHVYMFDETNFCWAKNQVNMVLEQDSLSDYLKSN